MCVRVPCHFLLPIMFRTGCQNCKMIKRWAGKTFGYPRLTMGRSNTFGECCVILFVCGYLGIEKNFTRRALKLSKQISYLLLVLDDYRNIGKIRTIHRYDHSVTWLLWYTYFFQGFLFIAVLLGFSIHDCTWIDNPKSGYVKFVWAQSALKMRVCPILVASTLSSVYF